MGLLSITILGLGTLIIALLIPFVSLRVKVLGFSRPLSSIQSIHGNELRIIPDTIHCEDLHYHKPSNLLFSACEDNLTGRHSWFPPLARFIDHTVVGQGHIQVIDPKTFTSKRLSLEGFTGAFVSHGIDIWYSKNEPDSVYIFAVNHLPNPEYYESQDKASTGSIPKARSQIEVFHHIIGSSSAKHLRSIFHPLIQTPNDIYASNSTSFYVTNDHFYREGLIRDFEDVGYQRFAGWTDIIQVSIKTPSTRNSSEGVDARIAHQGIHNNNGLGHGKSERDILIVDAAGGKLFTAVQEPTVENPAALRIIQPIQFASTLDNPFYFDDPYAKSTENDASGHVMAGLARACDLGASSLDPKGQDPVMVWLAKPVISGQKDVDGDGWNKTLIFQDDGLTLRSASAAVIIAIDPSKNDGKKQGWLFVTGFLSRAMVATKIDLN